MSNIGVDQGAIDVLLFGLKFYSGKFNISYNRGGNKRRYEFCVFEKAAIWYFIDKIATGRSTYLDEFFLINQDLPEISRSTSSNIIDIIPYGCFFKYTKLVT